jgi:hypothetical protein
VTERPFDGLLIYRSKKEKTKKDNSEETLRKSERTNEKVGKTESDRRKRLQQRESEFNP